MRRRIVESLRSWEAYAYLIIVLFATAAIVLAAGEIVHQERQTRHLTQEIQRQRIDGILRQCRNQNERNITAHHYLNQLLKKSGVSAKRRKASQSQAGGFIDAIVPRRNCLALAHLQVTQPPKPAPRTTTTTQAPNDN